LETHYCIYTDKLIDSDKSNIEHIIPLGLGGCNQFCIRVDKEKNSELGSRIDGRLSNDYLISSLRRHKGFKGHTGKIPETKLMKSKITATNRPVQVIFKGKSSYFYDPIDKRKLSDSETQGINFTSTIKIEKNARMLFTAKVLLAAGYFVYGQTFKDYADHDSLRKLMNYKLTETDESIKDLPVGIIDPFHDIPERDMGMKGVFEMICRATDSSCVMFLLCTENIIGSVGIGGQYIGSINFKTDTKHFPNEGKFRLGHVLGVQDRKLKRSSFYHMTELLQKNIQARK
jgi:hypothetical protein